MSKVEDIIAATKLNELIRRKDEDDKTCRTVLWVLAIVGAIAAVAAIAYAVYCSSLPPIIWRILKKILTMILTTTSLTKKTRCKIKAEKRRQDIGCSVFLFAIKKRKTRSLR